MDAGEVGIGAEMGKDKLALPLPDVLVGSSTKRELFAVKAILSFWGTSLRGKKIKLKMDGPRSVISSKVVVPSQNWWKR